MTRRDAAREETSSRIVEATVKLHGERGVLGTSWQDIAREADVSVSTVYSHFPSLEELLPACGHLVMERVRPPTVDTAAQIIGEARNTRERLIRVAHELFAFYERGGAHIVVDVRERQLPGMADWEESQRATVAALVRAALVDERPASTSIRRICAFFDLPTYRAMRTRGVSSKEAIETAVEVALHLLRRPAAAERGGS